MRNAKKRNSEKKISDKQLEGKKPQPFKKPDTGDDKEKQARMLHSNMIVNIYI